MENTNKRGRPTFDEFLNEEGIREEVETIAIKELFAMELEALMKKKHVRKVEMAKRMEASRATLDRLLDPQNGSIKLDTIIKAAEVLGKRLEIKLV